MPSSNSNPRAAHPQRKTINSQQAVVSSSRVPWHYCASNPRMITQSRDASSALATRTATAAEPTRTSQKSSELRSVSKARRPAGSAPQCCKPQIGHSVMCRSVRAGVRACGREHLQRQQQQQASPKQRKRVFLASPPLPSLGASLEYASGRKMRHPRSKWEKGVRPWPAHPAACCAAGPTRDALACGGPNGLCSQLLVSLLLLAGVVCAGSARAMYLGWGSCLLVGFLFLVSFCEVRVLVSSTLCLFACGREL